MTTVRALTTTGNESTRVAGELLRRTGQDRLILGYAVLWIGFVISGFRPPWQPIDVDEESSGSALRQLVFTFGALLALYRLVVSGTGVQVLCRHLGVVLFGVGLVATLVYSTDPSLTVKRAIIYLFGALFLICTVHTSTRPVSFFLRASVFSIAAAAWISLAASVVFPANCTSLEIRPGLAGVAPHPNVLGPCLQLGLILSLGLTPARGSEAIAVRIGQVGMAVALLMTDSVTSIVATLAGAGAFFALSANSYRAGALRVAAGAAAGVVGFIGMDTLREVFFATANRDSSLSGRDVLWDKIWLEFFDRPIFGVGYGSFWYDNRGIDLVTTWNPRQSHHAYLEVLVELGVVGMVLVAVLFGGGLWLGYRRLAGPAGTAQRRAMAAMAATAIALCGFNAFSESFLLRLDKLPFFVLLWILLLMQNRDGNRLEVEFSSLPSPTRRRRPLVRADA